MRQDYTFEYYVENRHKFIGGIVEELVERIRQSRDGYYCYNGVLQNISIPEENQFYLHNQFTTLGGNSAAVSPPQLFDGWHYFSFYMSSFRISDRSRNGIERTYHRYSHDTLVTDIDDCNERTEFLHLTDQDNQIKKESLDFSRLANLKELSLSFQNLNEYKNRIRFPSDLTSLLLSGCSLESLPESIGELEKLEILIFVANPLSNPWQAIENCGGLNVLATEECGIEEIPDSIAAFGNLEELEVNYNNLKHVSPAIGSLEKLLKLDLSGNEELRTLPDEIGQLSKLRELNLSNTALRELPDSVARLENLTTLNLFTGEELSRAPEAILTIPSLKRLVINVDQHEKERVRRALPDCAIY